MRTRFPSNLLGFAFLAAAVGLGACQGYVADAGGTSDRPTWDSTETCGDGQDNDGDGVADEGCGCTRGETQACFTGHPTQRGVGSCRDGSQTCEASDEFTGWGDCTGATLPSNDGLGDGIDQDCSGEDGPADECLPSEYGEGCFNGHDEDCDGLEDCEDPDCAAKCEEGPGGGSGGGGGGGTGGGGGGGGGGGEPTCPATGPSPEECGNGIDDDCDGTTDCEDYNCLGRGACDACVPESCTNDVDDDCDGRADCDDADCNTSADCNGRGDGGSGEGGPGGDNGLPPNPPGTGGGGGGGGGGGSGGGSDCEEECVPGNFRWCDSPIQCRWAKQQCNPDGSWGTCVETGDKAPGCTSTFYDTICCLAADNQCCQDYPGYGSIGECDTQVVRTCR